MSSAPKGLDGRTTSNHTNPYAVDVIRAKRRDLIYGISRTEDLLNLLLIEGIITAAKKSIILTLRSGKDQNVRILDIVEAKGERACRKFFHPCLMVAEPGLYHKIKTFVGDVNECFQDTRRQLIGYLLEQDQDAEDIKKDQNQTQRTNVLRSPRINRRASIPTNQRNVLEPGTFEHHRIKGKPDLIQLIATNGDLTLVKHLTDTDVNRIHSSKKTLLHVAAEHGNLPATELLIWKGAKVNLQDNAGCTALHKAASRGHTEIVKALLQAGAPIHVVDCEGNTPVHLAADSLQVQSVSALVKEETTQPERVRDDTFLHMAAKEDNWKLLELLLQNGADADITDNKQKSALFHAVQKSNAKAVEVLLTAGAKVNFDIIDEAIKSRHDTILQLLLATPRGSLGKDMLGASLFSAVRQNQDQMMHLLIKAGADVNICDEHGYTPLLLSAELGHTEVFRVLVEECARLSDRLPSLSSALHLAVQSGSPVIVQTLLGKGVDLNSKTAQGFTPLHIAAQCDRPDVASLMLKAGAQVNAVNQEGLTPLHVASQLGHTDVAVQLVDANASCELKDRQGRTALHMAAYSGGKSHVMNVLLSADANVNVPDNQKKTALHYAATMGNENMVTSLLSHKAKVIARDMDGSTPLHCAAAGGHASIVSALLRPVNNRGLEDRNVWRKTALHVAAEKGHDDVVVLLLEAGAKINATDQSKDTPLHCAARGGHQRAVESLLNWGQTGQRGRHSTVKLQMTNKVGKTALQVAEGEESPQHDRISTVLRKRMLLTK